MKKKLLICLILSISSICYCQNTNWGVQFSNAIIDRYQPTINVMTNKGWDHSNSIILHGMEKIYTRTNNPLYVNYIKSFADSYVAEDGAITGLIPALDGIHPGLICLFLYEKTGKIKYKTAATNMRNYLLGTAEKPGVLNKTPEGGFWHKNEENYRNVMNADGIYMAYPFLVKYGKMFNDSICFDVATFQTLLIASHSFNISNNLPYHSWDYSKSKSWSNPITGTSSQVWSRSVGWFAMALADILENLPSTHKDYNSIKYLFQQLALGIKNSQNARNGLWYQVVNKADAPGNYPETSGSGMIIYAIKKGADHSWIDPSYSSVASKGWQGLKEYIGTFSDGKPLLNSVAPAMGCKNNMEEYLAVRPVTCPSSSGVQYPHGYCGVLMAASVMEDGK